MSLPTTSGPYVLGPDEGEPLWFNGVLGILKATAEQTDGRFAAFEVRAPRAFGPPLHIHKDDDEFFLVLSGEVRLQHGDQVVEGETGSLLYTPRGISHSFCIDSDEARVLLFFGPAGQEGAFREMSTPARTFGPPPADEPIPDRETQIEVMRRFGVTVVGPPLQPRA